MAGLGTRSAIERAESGNSRPTVVRACALLDRYKTLESNMSLSKLHLYSNRYTLICIFFFL